MASNGLFKSRRRFRSLKSSQVMIRTRSRQSVGSTLDDLASTVTRHPSDNSRATRWTPTKPVAPVTSTSAADIVPHSFTVLLDLRGGDLRGLTGVRGKIPIPVGRQSDRVEKR